MYNRVDMGFGKVAVGECICADTGVPGLIYLELELEKPRPHGTDCADIYPVGEAADPDKVLACIHFHTLATVDQTIEVMQNIRKKFTEQV